MTQKVIERLHHLEDIREQLNKMDVSEHLKDFLHGLECVEPSLSEELGCIISSWIYKYKREVEHQIDEL